MTGSVMQLLLENVQPRPRRRGWHGGPTPLGALRGVTADQARWRPGPRRKSIWDLTLHIAYWKYAVRRRLEDRSGSATNQRFPRRPSNWPTPTHQVDSRAWAADVALLRDEHEKLLAAIAALSESQLNKRLGGGRQWTYGELIVGIAQHDAYHTGQIQLVKRLWAERHGD